MFAKVLFVMDSEEQKKHVGKCGVCGGSYEYDAMCAPNTVVYCKSCRAALFAGSGNPVPMRQKANGCTVALLQVGAVVCLIGLFLPFLWLLGVPLLVAGGLWHLIAGKKDCLPDGLVAQTSTVELTEDEVRDKRKRTVVTLAWVAVAAALFLVQQTFFPNDGSILSGETEAQKERVVPVYPRDGVATVAHYSYGFSEQSYLFRMKKFRKDFDELKRAVDDSLLGSMAVLLKPGQEVSIQSSVKGMREVLTLDGKRVWVYVDCLKPIKRIKKSGDE